jgi:hypothetical protein
MTHLQQSVTRKAKSAIADFRYNGSHYHEVQRCLENRFGKPHVVVQSHLNNLSKMTPVSENDINSISNYSRAINTMVWTFEDLGYDDDLKAASNVKTAVEKLPTSMILKWNKHLLHNKVSRQTITVLAKWLQEQAEAHELLPMRCKPKYNPPGKWNGSQHGGSRPGNNVNSQFNNALSAHPDAGTPTPCALGDGNHHTFRCPQFIALIPDDIQSVTKHFGQNS